MREKRRLEEFEISLKEFGIEKTSSMFDIKQFLCHLMGIASQKDCKTPVTFLYLFFMPSSDDVEITERIKVIFDELQDEITTIFNSLPIKNFVKKNNIKLTAIAEKNAVMEDLTNETSFGFLNDFFNTY